MLVGVGLVLVGLAAAVHVVIFYLQSLAWTSERARAVFGMTEQQAGATRELAFNQGFYNLFLAVMAAAGMVVWGVGEAHAGLALIAAGAGSMSLAALVLFASSPDKRGAALKQGTLPVLGLICLIVGHLVP